MFLCVVSYYYNQCSFQIYFILSKLLIIYRISHTKSYFSKQPLCITNVAAINNSKEIGENAEEKT